MFHGKGYTELHVITDTRNAAQAPYWHVVGGL